MNLNAKEGESCISHRVNIPGFFGHWYIPVSCLFSFAPSNSRVLTMEPNSDSLVRQSQRERKKDIPHCIESSVMIKKNPVVLTFTYWIVCTLILKEQMQLHKEKVLHQLLQLYKFEFWYVTTKNVNQKIK